MTNIKEINYENYGSCISISNQTIELIVTVEKGPRIVLFRILLEKKTFYFKTKSKNISF